MRLNDYLAQKYGSNYRDVIHQAAQDTGLSKPADEVEQDTNFWSNLGAGSYSALNSVLMGIPDFLVKNIGGESGSKALEDLRKYHKTASDIGEGVGTVGSLLIPGGAVVKGVGLGAKALGATKAAETLGKAAQYLKGGELTGNLAQKAAQGALRGMGQAAEQGVVRGLTNLDLSSPEALSESAGQSLEGLTAGIGIGGLAGGVLGPAVQKILGKQKLTDAVTGKKESFGETGARFGLNELREKLDDATLEDAGISTRGLRQAVGKLGYNNRVEGARLIEDYKADVAKTLRDQGITGKKGWEALFAKNKQQWQDIDDAFNAVNPDPAIWKPRLADKLAKDADIQAFIADSPNPKIAQDMLTDAISEIGARKGIMDIRSKLANVAKAYIRSQDVDKVLQARAAMAIKNKVDDFVADNSLKSATEIQDAKHLYKVLQPFLITDTRDATTLAKMFDAGPGTAEKLIANSLFAGGGGALGVGSSIMGQSQTGEDIDLGKALQAGLYGALAGGVAKKALPAIGNKALAMVGRQGAKALESEKLQDAIEKGIGAASNVPKLPAGLAISDALAEKEIDIPEINGPAEPQVGTEVADQSSPALSPRLQYVLGNRLNYLYSTVYADQIPPDQFLDAVKRKTNNFTDQQSLSKILFDDPAEQDDYLRQVQAYEDLKGLDLDKAIQGRGGLETPLGTIGGDEAAGAELDKLVNTILNLQNKGDLLKRTDSQDKQVRKVVAQLRKNPELLPQFIESAGLDFAQLRDLGVI